MRKNMLDFENLFIGKELLIELGFTSNYNFNLPENDIDNIYEVYAIKDIYILDIKLSFLLKNGDRVDSIGFLLLENLDILEKLKLMKLDEVFYNYTAIPNLYELLKVLEKKCGYTQNEIENMVKNISIETKDKLKIPGF